jgi:nucleoside phosphorylase
MLDEEYQSTSGGTEYILGRVGSHNVIVLYLPAGQIGTNAAAIVGAVARSNFPGLRAGLMVGVGGGVPSAVADVRLGDVVVSHPQLGNGGVVQYDMGKAGSGGQFRRIGHLNSPPEGLLKAVTLMRSKILMGDSRIANSLSALSPGLMRPTVKSDILFQPAYDHIRGPTCNACSKRMSIRRSPRDSHDPVIHYGTIASGNQDIKDGMTRDRLSEELGVVLCFEMKAAGLMNHLSCLVIRGICDYADSHKNKAWRPFAAAAAAACAKELLLNVSVSQRHTDTAAGDSRGCICARNFGGPIIYCPSQVTRPRLPPAVQFRDIVTLNDALGETYPFSLSFIDSVEVRFLRPTNFYHLF